MLSGMLLSSCALSAAECWHTLCANSVALFTPCQFLDCGQWRTCVALLLKRLPTYMVAGLQCSSTGLGIVQVRRSGVACSR